MIKRFISEKYGNSATIEKSRGLAYKGAPQRTEEYILSCYADYDNGKMYYRAIYESYEAARNKLNTISCGLWKEI